MTDSVPSTPAPSDEGPPTSGQVAAQPAIVDRFAFRKREGLPGVEYCEIGPTGDLVGPWFPFVPDANVSAAVVGDLTMNAMALLAAQLVACPTGSPSIPRQLADLASVLTALSD